MPIDIAPLWDFAKPELSEQRFRDALGSATSDDALILHTQIARTYGLRRDFERARDILRTIEPQIGAAGPEARARFALELGRTYASATHPPESQTAQAKERARAAYLQAFEIARKERLDALAPAEQLKWGREALALVEASSHPSAKRWEASIRNNVGHALHELRRYDEALAELKRAVALRERGSGPQATRIAHWMVARTLRAMDRIDEALEIQLRLKRENDAAGVPDPYVLEELELLYARRKKP